VYRNNGHVQASIELMLWFSLGVCGFRHFNKGS